MKKHLRYANYLLRHKWFVLVAGLRTKAPLWRLLIHDWSKFLPCEWVHYATSFYGPRPRTGEVKAAFNYAWLHHIHANPHHWQHWSLREDSGAVKILEIPDHFTKEMLADWMGAGRAITGKWDIVEWYKKNRDIIQLAPNTRWRVEHQLGCLYPELWAV